MFIEGAWGLFCVLLLPNCLAYQQHGLQSSLLYPQVAAYYGSSLARPLASEIQPEHHDRNHAAKQPERVFYLIPILAQHYPQIPPGYGSANYIWQPSNRRPPVNHILTELMAYYSLGTIPSSPAFADQKSPGSLQPPFALRQPPVPEEFLIPTFRGFGTLRARASLRISSSAHIGEAYFYQATPTSDVLVSVTGHGTAGPPTVASPPAKDIVVLTGDTTPDCSRQPSTNAALNNPIFNPQNVVGGGVLVPAHPVGNEYTFISDKVSRNSITLSGINSIVGRYLLVAEANANPGAGTAQICGRIVSL